MYHVTQSFRDLGCHLGCHEVAANKRYTGSPPSVLPSLRRRITRVELGGTGTHTGQGCSDAPMIILLLLSTVIFVLDLLRALLITRQV